MAKRTLALGHSTSHKSPTELDDDFSKVIGMARPREESDIADRTIAAMRASKTVLLDVGDALHDQPDRVQNYASNVSSGTECWLRELRDFWRVEDRDG
jgi:hypothetical protein